MPGWSHSKKDVREALDAAVAGGFKVEDTSTHGHSWGWVRCAVCGQKFSVWSTPKSPGTHARQIRQFVRRHGHEDEVTGR